MRRSELVVLLLILALTAGLRFYKLDAAPPGLYPDEAMNGTNALDALATGDFKLFYPENNGREGLFINIQALAVRELGNTVFALRMVSAIIGTLTVLATYLLARRLFDDWRTAAIAAFLMAVGFWHLNFSRIGWRAIMAPFCAAWGFYYVYKGFETHRLWHWALAGLFWGIGFHTYIAFRVMPLALILTLIAYWWSLRVAYADAKYAHARHQLLGGVAMMAAIVVLIVLPMGAYFATHPADFAGRTDKVSVFAADNPLLDLAKNFGLTLGMFFIYGDGNWRHNLAGEPVLFWPVAALFAVGLVRTIYRFVHSWRVHHHPGVVQTLLLSWFFVALLPGILSNEGIPHALRVLTAAPAVYLMAAVGLHWFVDWMLKWYAARDRHVICLPWFSHAGRYGRAACLGEGTLIVWTTTVVLLFAIGVAEVSRYWNDWARNPNVVEEFTQRYVRIADRINALPPSTLKYVVVSRGDVFVRGIPVSAQTVMYLTDTGRPETQQARHTVYLTQQQYELARLPAGAVVLHLDP